MLFEFGTVGVKRKLSFCTKICLGTHLNILNEALMSIPTCFRIKITLSKIIIFNPGPAGPGYALPLQTV